MVKWLIGTWLWAISFVTVIGFLWFHRHRTARLFGLTAAGFNFPNDYWFLPKSKDRERVAA